MNLNVVRLDVQQSRMKKIRVCYYLSRQARDWLAAAARMAGMSRSCYLQSIIRGLMEASGEPARKPLKEK